MAQIKDLTKEQLWQLRQEIVLNSLFISDYENSLGIDAKECNTFFEGYVEYLWELATSELDYTGNDIMWVFEKLDNKDNLADYALSIEWVD